MLAQGPAARNPRAATNTLTLVDPVKFSFCLCHLGDNRVQERVVKHLRSVGADVLDTIDFSKNVNPDSRSLYTLCMKSELGTNSGSCHKKEQEAEWARGSHVFHRVQVRLLEVRRLPLCF